MLRHLTAVIVLAASLLAHAGEEGPGNQPYERAKAFANGIGVLKDTKRAIEWFEKAYATGAPRAAYDLGMLYASNLGIPADFAKAAEWFEKADSPEAAHELAKLYAEGKGVKRDEAKAFSYYLKAATGGIFAARSEVARRYILGLGTAKSDSSAATWYRIAADQGDVEAMLVYARMLEDGTAGRRDPVEMANLVKEAAMQNNREAQHRMGELCAAGTGTPRDEVAALAWFNVAATAGSPASVQARDALEARLGRDATLKAQEMGRQLFRDIVLSTYVAKAPEPQIVLSPEYADSPRGQGSGALISPDGLILTAHHVIHGANHVVVLHEGITYAAEIERVDPANDLAVLRIKASGLPALPMAPSTAARLGTPVATLGYPNPSVQGTAMKATRGEINSLDGSMDEVRDWQISVPVQSGNSGGPLLDEYGRILGVVVSKLNGPVGEDLPQNVSYARKGAYVRAFLEPYEGEFVAGPDDSVPPPSFADMVAHAKSAVVWVRIY